jgi:hypothetical protein
VSPTTAPTVNGTAAYDVPTATDNVPVPAPGPEPVDPAAEAAQASAVARRGLGTKRALYYRIGRTRQLLWAWKQAGKYLSDPARFITRPTEATELIHELTAVRTLLRAFPPLLGQAGQPGYLVLALARQQMIVPTFQTLLPSQREALARDWQAGFALLTAHRQFLREELRVHRLKGRGRRAVRAVRDSILNHPGVLLLVTALLALNLAWAPLREAWWYQILFLLALLALRLILWWSSLRLTKLIRRRPAPARAQRARPRPQVQRQAH